MKTDPGNKKRQGMDFADGDFIESIPEITKMFFENSLDAMMIGSQDGRIYKANSAACTLLGYSEAELCNIGRKGIVDQTSTLKEAVRKRKESGNFFGEKLPGSDSHG